MSPSGPPNPDHVRVGARLLEGWGLRVELAPHALGRLGYVSGSDEERLLDLQRALDDPDCKGVLCTRGGYGSDRIVDRLDLSRVRAAPKVFVGFSDITALHLRLVREVGLVTFYGPPMAWDTSRNGPLAEASLRRLVRGGPPGLPLVFTPRPDEPTGVLTAGSTAEGVLVGGNLTIIAASIGTQSQPALAGRILFLEDVGEEPYRVDRMLTHLERSGVLSEVAGVLLGQFTSCKGNGDEPTVVDVLGEHLGRLDVPVLGGLAVGHACEQETLPLGLPVRIDGQRRTVTCLTEPTV